MAPRSSEFLQPEMDQVSPTMREDRLGHDVVEGLAKGTAIKTIVMKETGLLDPDLIRADLALDRILDQPTIGFDPAVMSGIEIRDQETSRAQGAATETSS